MNSRRSLLIASTGIDRLFTKRECDVFFSTINVCTGVNTVQRFPALSTSNLGCSTKLATNWDYSNLLKYWKLTILPNDCEKLLKWVRISGGPPVCEK